MSLLIGIDVGTTHCKGGVYDYQGKECAFLKTDTQIRWDCAGGAVIDANTLWESVCFLVKGLTDKVNPKDIDAISVASMAEAGVPLDRHGQPLYPIICWFDKRSQPQSDWWVKNFGPRFVFEITGVVPSYKYTLTKLMWLKAEHPQIITKCCTWLCVADYICYLLGGKKVMNKSLACRTMAFDLTKDAYSREMLEVAGVPHQIMPPIVESGQVIGSVSALAARETGLLQGTPVVTGGHDHVCGALATGILTDEYALDSSGTAEAVIVALNSPRLDWEIGEKGLTVGHHVMKDMYYLMGGMSASGASVEWFKSFVEGKKKENRPGISYNTLMSEAANFDPFSTGLVFVPYLRGSGAPWPDPSRKGAILGLRDYHGQAHVTRAILEGVSFQLRAAVLAIQEVLGHQLDHLRVTGGGAKNKMWLQLKADITGKHFEVPQVEEASTLGAALLAGVGAGVYENGKQAAHSVYRVKETVFPDKEKHRIYVKAFEDVYVPLQKILGEVDRLITSSHLE
ncbi:hypothetical protein DRJ04_05240 [Candidatus Aerophobetes bacterium]|uniref:Carbohydrate kinase n=1 Tax=Aerophobetes bacterium TaxID=2030807 RepID=A0A662DF43_UNCAE|nr:MAG: hypothetical protein DRJ04_05240 [Candidatus Aerophobetes bacterium]